MGRLQPKVMALALVACALAAVGLRCEGGAGAPATGQRPVSLRPIEPPVEPPFAGPAAASRPAPSAGRGAVPGRRAPAAAAGPAEGAATEPPAARAPWTVRGRVLDAEARQLAGVPVVAARTEARAVSGGGGWFELAAPWERGAVVTDDPAWCTLYEGVFARGGARPTTLVVARAARFEGRVVDELGRPRPEAHVRRELPEDLGARLGDEVEATRPTTAWLRLDETGRFAFDGPALAGAALVALAAGYDEARVALDPAGALGLELVLRRTEVTGAGVVRGRVVDARGAPVEAARVALGLASTLTDEAGRFALLRERAVTTERLVAVAPGFLPAALLRPLPLDEGVGGWPEDVVLVLGGAPLTIAGRVVGADGAPVGDVQVWLRDAERFGVAGDLPLEVEALAAGAALPPAALASAARPRAADGDELTTSRTTIEPPSAVWNYVLTDAQGAFELRGLADRDYGLRFLDRRVGAVLDGPRVAAGTRDVELVLPGDATVESFAGLVRGADGRPVEGVGVTWSVAARTVSARVLGGTNEVTYAHRGARAVTDGEGRFRFTDLPRQELVLSLASDRIAPATVSLSKADVERGTVTVPVEVRCRFRVRVADGSPLRGAAVAVAARAGDGGPLEVLRIRGESVTSYTSFPLDGGATEVLAATSAARALVLLDAHDGVLAERSVALSPDGTTEVEF